MPDGRLFIWPKGSRKVDAVKQVVEDLGLPFAVKPFWYSVETSTDAPRVLVLEEGFENGPVVNYIRPMKKAQLPEAVQWALGLTESRGARDQLDTMKKIFGEDLVMRIEEKPQEEEDDDGDWSR